MFSFTKLAMCQVELHSRNTSRVQALSDRSSGTPKCSQHDLLYVLYGADVGVIQVPHMAESSPGHGKRRQEPAAARKTQGEQGPVLTWQGKFFACQSLRP